MPAIQLPLFPASDVTEQPQTRSPSLRRRLSARSPLAHAIESFEPAMRQKGFTQNTIDSFLDDLRLLTRYMGDNRPVGQITFKDLKEFLDYLVHGRGKPCNAKSLARRKTTCKVFFGWLAEVEIIANDPAAALVHEPVSTPLPQILFEDEIDRLEEAGQQLRSAEKRDARPLFLFQFLLHTGMKKAECMAVRLSDLDIADPGKPSVFIRYEDTRRRHKERRLTAGQQFVPLLREYRSQYHPQVQLFECTSRNLEYVLRDLGVLAGVHTPVAFETLRTTCAVRDFRRGVAPEALRVKLGLSRISWEDTLLKLERLAAPPL